MGLDDTAKLQKRGIDIRHTGKVARVHSPVQSLYQLRRVQSDPMMRCMQVFVHCADKRRVRPRLKLRCMEIALIVLVPHRKRVQGLIRLGKGGICHRRQYAGIQPARNQCPHLHIGHQLAVDSIQQKLAQTAHGGGKIIGMLMVGQVPVAAQAQVACVGVKLGALAGQKLPYTAKHPAAGHAARTQQHNLRQPVRVDFRLYRRVCQQGFQFAAKDNAVLLLGIKQRLDAAAVARQKQYSLLLGPHSKGKNSVAAFYTGTAPLSVGVQQHLSVRMSGKGMPAALQGSAQFGRIVQFAVIHNHIGFALPLQLHGLGAVFGVNDTQPRVQQRCLPAAIDAPLVRPAPCQRFLHCVKCTVVFLHGAGTAPHLPRYATHKKAPFADSSVTMVCKRGNF